MKIFCNECKDWLETAAERDNVYAGMRLLNEHRPKCPGDIKTRFDQIVSGLRL